MKFCYYFLFMCVLQSCATTYQPVIQEEVFDLVEDENLRIEMVYIGATPNYHIVETIIHNKSDQHITLERSDFEMNLIKRKESYKPLANHEITHVLLEEKKTLKKEKKNRLIWGIVSTGVSTALGATSGLSVAENILFTAENTLYVLDEEKFLKRNINSIDGELDYIKTANMGTHHLEPNETISKDLLFPIIKLKGTIELIYRSIDTDYILSFESSDLIR